MMSFSRRWPICSAKPCGCPQIRANPTQTTGSKQCTLDPIHEMPGLNTSPPGRALNRALREASALKTVQQLSGGSLVVGAIKMSG